MTNSGDSDEWWKQYGGTGVSPESGAAGSAVQPTAMGYEYPSSPELPPQYAAAPEPPAQYVSAPAPQPQSGPQPPQYPNYQQPYGQGGYGYQQPYPQSGYYGAQPVGYPGSSPLGTNGLAIAALCCSLVSVGCGVTAIMGIILGAVALSQINKTGQAGRGMALAGIWIGVVLIVLFVAYFVFLFAVAEGM